MKKFNLLSIILLLTCLLHAQVGINTENPEATLHVNGNLKITDTPILTSSTSLVIDTDGNVGTAASIPAKVMLVQSTNRQIYNKSNTKDLEIINQLNNAQPIIVTWQPQDIQTNNILTFASTDQSFTFLYSGTFELSGYINYTPSGKYPKDPTNTHISERYLGLNVCIQQYNPSLNKWVDIAASRYLTSDGSMGTFASTIIVPPVLSKFEEGDKIRMIFTRPSKTFGIPHGSLNEICYIGIDAPTGIKFTKGMKVIAY